MLKVDLNILLLYL